MANSLLDYLAAAREDRASNRQEIDESSQRAETAAPLREPARASTPVDTPAQKPLKTPENASARAPASAPVGGGETVTLDKVADFMELDLRRVLVWLQAGLKFAVLLALFGAAAAAGYGIFSKPRYTVSTELLIDPSGLQVIANDLYTPPGQVDAQLLDLGSRVRILTSGNVLARTVASLKLHEDPEFYKPSSPGLLSSLKGASVVKPDPELAAVKALREKIGVSTDERSFIATLFVSSQTVEKAIRISNAMVSAFKDELASADAEGARRAAGSLDERLERLKSDVLIAEEKVEDYRRSHNLSVGENGQLVSTATISQLNSQIAQARSRVIDAQVAYNSLRAAQNAPGNAQAAVSPALAELLQRVGVMQQQFEDQKIIFGERHPSIIRLKAQLSSLREQVRLELSRARNAAKTELDKANAALEELSEKMAELEGRAFTAGESQVELRELQRDATAKAAIYESYLSRARQMAEREQINTTNIRVISAALPPAGRSWPPSTVLLVVAGAMAGFIFGLGLAIVRGMIGDLRQPHGSLEQD